MQRFKMSTSKKCCKSFSPSNFAHKNSYTQYFSGACISTGFHFGSNLEQFGASENSNLSDRAKNSIGRGSPTLLHNTLYTHYTQ